MLGSLILFHNQKSESGDQISEVPEILQVELTAELPAKRIKDFRFQSGGSFSKLIPQIINSKLWNPAKLDPASCLLCIKRQLDIFLDLRPILYFRSGLYLYHSSSSEVPPVCCF